MLIINRYAPTGETHCIARCINGQRARSIVAGWTPRRRERNAPEFPEASSVYVVKPEYRLPAVASKTIIY